MEIPTGMSINLRHAGNVAKLDDDHVVQQSTKSLSLAKIETNVKAKKTKNKKNNLYRQSF